MKIDYSILSFSDRCKVTMDGQDGWGSGYSLHGNGQHEDNIDEWSNILVYLYIMSN